MSRLFATFKILMLAAGILFMPSKNDAQVIEFTGRIINGYSQTTVSGVKVLVIDKYTSEALFQSSSGEEGIFHIRVPASERIFMRIEADLCDPLDISYRELSALHLDGKQDIKVFPSYDGSLYTYELELPARSGKNGYVLTVWDEDHIVVHQGTINSGINRLPVSLKMGRAFEFELKSKDILTRSWSILWKEGSEPEVNYQFSLHNDAIAIENKKRGQTILKHTLGIYERAINVTYEIQGLDYEVTDSYISAKSGLALNEVIRIVRANPDVLFELGNHSKDFGDRNADLNLSEVRAHIAVDYLNEMAGIPSDQIAPKGYGNVQLTNGCPGRLKCREMIIFKQHEHTRTLLKIIGFKKQTSPMTMPKSNSERPDPEANGMGVHHDEPGQRPLNKIESHSPIKQNYTGQAVQILVVKELLPQEHKLLADQRIIISERPQKGYAYIAVPDKGAESVRDLLNRYRENYKDAFVVNLKNGKRIP